MITGLGLVKQIVRDPIVQPGLGHKLFKLATRVQIPLGSLKYKTLVVHNCGGLLLLRVDIAKVTKRISLFVVVFCSLWLFPFVYSLANNWLLNG